MSDKSRSCPKCKAAMDFRLGQFDCPNCGHTELAEQPQAQPRTSGPGFQPLLSGDPTGSTANAGALAGGTLYDQNASLTGPGAARKDSLDREKSGFFWIIVGAEVLPLPLMLLAGLADTDGSMLLVALIYAVVIAIRLSIMHWVIMGDSVWVKCVVIVINAIWVLVLAAFLVSLTQEDTYSISAAGYSLDAVQASGYAVFAGGYVVLSIAWIGWFISILWRDIRSLKV